MKNFLTALLFIVCILIIIFQQKQVIVLTNQYYKIKWMHYADSLIMEEVIKDSCNKCGHVQDVNLMLFNIDTIENQKIRKYKQDSLYLHHD